MAVVVVTATRMTTADVTMFAMTVIPMTMIALATIAMPVIAMTVSPMPMIAMPVIAMIVSGVRVATIGQPEMKMHLPTAIDLACGVDALGMHVRTDRTRDDQFKGQKNEDQLTH